MYDFMQMGTAPFALGTCVGVERGTGVQIVLPGADAGAAIVPADCLDQVAVGPGDQVLVVRPEGADRPVVIGTIGAAPRPPLRLASGYTVAAEVARVQLHGPDGRLALEIDTAGPAPTVRPVAGDLTLDLEGRLTVAARSIEMQAKLGGVQIKANDDVVVEGERIRLN